MSRNDAKALHLAESSRHLFQKSKRHSQGSKAIVSLLFWCHAFVCLSTICSMPNWRWVLEGFVFNWITEMWRYKSTMSWRGDNKRQDSVGGGLGTSSKHSYMRICMAGCHYLQDVNAKRLACYTIYISGQCTLKRWC